MKITQIASLRTLKNIYYLIISTSFNAATGLLVVVLFTNYATKELYGQYNYILAILALFSIFSIQGLPVAIVNSVSEGHEGDFIRGSLLRIKYSILGAICLVIFSFYYVVKAENQIFYAFILACIPYIFYFSLNHIDSYYIGKKKYYNVMLFRVVVSLINLASVFVCIFYLKKLVYFIVFHLGFISIFYIINYLLIKKNIADKNSFDPKFISFAKNMTLLGVMGQIVSNIDKIIIGAFFGYKELAVYSIGLLLHSQLKRGYQILVNIVQPNAVKYDLKNAFSIYNKKLLFFYPILIIIFLLGFYLIPSLIPILFTVKYNASIVYAQLFLLPTFLGVPGWIYDTILRAHQLSRQLYFIRVISYIIMIVSLIFGAYLFGIKGIIISRIMLTLSGTIVGYIIINRKVMKSD
ncbi:lipopolysaccharide biosynthesis protein [bacterium]